ncbi:MAG: high-potential iron-sulfur protein [Gammaproteobacteria bacterium]|nr:high-potential iron-sulfur protein [Gammaproteobacteria bacterium]
MQHHDKHRRRFMACVVAGGVVLPAARALLGTKAFAQAEDTMPKLEHSDPAAKALSYTHDAGTAKENPAWAEGEICSNCLHIQGGEGETWRPCAIFPGKRINADGWCSARVAKG